MTNQQADLVLGQSSFETEAVGSCNETTVRASAVAGSNGKLYGRDAGGRRILVWSPIPTISNAAADFALGQANLMTCGAVPVSGSSTGSNGGIAAAEGKLLVVDDDSHRVLFWLSPPTTDNAPAYRVIGQPDIVSTGSGNAADELDGPVDVWTDGTRVAVVEQTGLRVLIWNTFPTTNGEPADIVLGQSDFDVTMTPDTPSASNMSAPSGVASNGTQFAVADSAHNRVLLWTTFPTTNGQPADVVLGQASFTDDVGGLAADRMFAPHELAMTSDALFVTDTQNDRVLVFSPIPTTSGTEATFVLGQPDLDTGANNPEPSESSIETPRGIDVVDDHLWVTDEGHRRLLRFTLYPDQ